MTETATVNIPKDVLEPIVRSQVAAGIVEALGKPEQLISKVVAQALKQKVDSKGSVSTHNYDNRYDLIELLATNGIHSVVRESLGKWIEEQRPAIEAQVKKALSRKESAFAKALVEGLITATRSEWSFKCNINFKED